MGRLERFSDLPPGIYWMAYDDLLPDAVFWDGTHVYIHGSATAFTEDELKQAKGCILLTFQGPLIPPKTLTANMRRCEECGAAYIPQRVKSINRYCSKRCGDRVAVRKFRERKRLEE